MAIDGVTSCMKIREVNKNKKQFISLLLLADEQESMVDRYLEKGTMYVLEDNDVKAECVVTDEGNGILEIKNIAVDPENQVEAYQKDIRIRMIWIMQRHFSKSWKRESDLKVSSCILYTHMHKKTETFPTESLQRFV